MNCPFTHCTKRVDMRLACRARAWSPEATTLRPPNRQITSVFVSSISALSLRRRHVGSICGLRLQQRVSKRSVPSHLVCTGNVQMVGPSPRASDDGKLDLDSTEEQKRRDVGRLLKLFGRLAAPYLRSGKQARIDAAGVIGMTLLQNGVSVALSYISRDFWSALNTKNVELFQHQALLFFVVLVACVPVITYGTYIRDMCALRWRTWMTDTVLKQYTENRAFYDIDQDGSLDNPDQRISSDLAAFTADSLAFILTVMMSAIDIVSFSAILYSIYPQLFFVLIGYAASGTAATIWLGKSFVALNRRQLVREADFRYALIRLRENAESVAFFSGEKREREDLSKRLSLAVQNMGELIGWQRNLGFFQTAYRYAVQVVPALVVSPKYFSGAIELGVVTQSFGAFSHIFNDLSIVVSRFDSLSQLGAQLGRIQEICDAVEAKTPAKSKVFSGLQDQDSTGGVDTPIAASAPSAWNGINMLNSSDGSLALADVSVVTPSLSNPRQLVKGISFKLSQGESLLIAGPSGVGKSSLIRAIAGLWNKGSGTITRPPWESIFFLPQRPYCTLGSLADNLMYPKQSGEDNTPNEAELFEILKAVDLHDLPARMGGLSSTYDWGDTLSLGEQQRLSFARLLLAKPVLAVIDEGTSALDLENEERLYMKLRELNVTVVSIGHRPSLLKYHDKILRIGRDDESWTLETIVQDQRNKTVAQVL